MPNSPDSVAHLKVRIAELESQLQATQVLGQIGNSLDTLFEGVQIIGHDWRYLYINDTAARHARRRAEALVGRSMTECFPGIADTEMFRRLQECRQRGSPQRYRSRFEYPDQSVAWFDLWINPIPQGLLVLSNEVSDLVHLERDLSTSREQLDRILLCMSEAVVVVDAAGMVRAVNPAGERLFGRASGRLVGRRLDGIGTFRDEQHGAREVDPLAPYLDPAAGEVPVQNLHLLTTRSQRISCTGGTLRDVDGAVNGAFLVIRDESETHRLDSHRRLVQKQEAISRFAGELGHDFNNLLTIIGGYCELALMAAPDPGPLQEQLQVIRRTCSRGAAMTSQLLALGGSRPVALQEIDVATVLGEIQHVLREVLGGDKRLELSVQGQLPAVLFDPIQFEQMLISLTMQASKASHGGCWSIVARRSSRSLCGLVLQGEVDPSTFLHLRFSDSEGTLDPERLGDPFAPSAGSGEKPVDGGLQLALVYSLVRQCGGQMVVENDPTIGTVFDIFLPEAVVPLREEDRTILPPSRSVPERGSTILVVDDDPGVVKLLLTVLGAAGYEVLQADDGAEALALFEREQANIDLILADMVMPRLSGWDLARAIRARSAQIPVVLMSGYTNYELELERHGMPAITFLDKPIAPTALVAHLGSLFAAAPREERNGL